MPNIFYSAAHGSFSKTGHILGHKTNLNKYNSMYSTQYYTIKVDSKKSSRKCINSKFMVIKHLITE